MEKDDRLNMGIGTKTTTLEPKVVEILSVQIETAHDKEDKEVGEKVVCTCKHPDREKPVDISGVKYEKKKQLVFSGLWFKHDEDMKLAKDSALAVLLRFLNLDTIAGLEGRKVATTLGDRGFLVFKAY